MTDMAHNIPSSSKALVMEARGAPLKLQLQARKTPELLPGSAVVKVLCASVHYGLRDALSGEVQRSRFPTPFIPGGRGVARIAAVGPDAATLRVGQLALVDPHLRARDDEDVSILFGISHWEGYISGSERLMADVWRDGIFAEYARLPLENLLPLNEKVLCGSLSEGGLGYQIADLHHILIQSVAYGGLRSIDVKAGERVIISPATGVCSAAAVEVASAMGCQVIAVGRNADRLQKIADRIPRVRVVELKGDVTKDTETLQQWGPVDAYFDISPAVAEGSTHVRSCLMALKIYGRASFMGVLQSDVPVSYVSLMIKRLTIKGMYMYEREDVRRMIKFAETGAVKLGEAAGSQVVGNFPLQDWEKAFDLAEKHPAPGKEVFLSP